MIESVWPDCLRKVKAGTPKTLEQWGVGIPEYKCFLNDANA